MNELQPKMNNYLDNGSAVYKYVSFLNTEIIKFAISSITTYCMTFNSTTMHSYITSLKC